MLRACRRATVVALAGAAAIAAQLAAVAPAQAATPTITIAATSKIKPVTGDVFVAFHAGALSGATIHGSISGATAGEVAVLYAQPFPYKTPAARLDSITLKTGKTAYSFTVTPTLATRYAVRLFATGHFKIPTAAPIATSPTKNLYVVGNGFWTGGANCGRPVCHETLHQYVIVPTSALGLEMSKLLLPYFGLSLGSANVPPPPKWLYLRAGHASVSAARRISAIEFERTISYSFTIGSHSYYWAWVTCLRDTVSKDGIGLPGYHGCGASRTPRTVAYLG